MNITKEDLRKALIGIKLTECYKQKYRNTNQIKENQNKPRVLSNLYRFDKLLNERIERLKSNTLLQEEEFILNQAVEEELNKGVKL